ncbi:hypothetical protein [Aeoliella mucimassa]|uniref:Uncharacterized protein n=1 Tax=Aeoliella mucimassa TaxID=2527972 RepID=A0A518AJB3_9BACT|nr:hypothetical protein [Aeoliella mucimassa]QDU54819.1 hypothetical protein Pan181_10020 [Aeoliella mucimassa]
MKFTIKRTLIVTTVLAVGVAIVANAGRWAPYFIPLKAGKSQYVCKAVDLDEYHFVFDSGSRMNCLLYLGPVNSSVKAMHDGPLSREVSKVAATSDVFHPIGLGYNSRADLTLRMQNGKLSIRDLKANKGILDGYVFTSDQYGLNTALGKGTMELAKGSTGRITIATFEVEDDRAHASIATQYEIGILMERSREGQPSRTAGL